jgi:GR25 family glycosyltransferase involved in LPS biosynthesis
MELIINELDNSEEPKLCLNMIVKNESHIIKDTLNKLLQKVQFDYWVISDTGSTDNTKQVITDFFKEKNIKGEFFDDEWLNFGHNRTKALEHAYGKSKYVLIFDADDEICGNFTLPELTKDGYFLQFGDANGVSYARIQIVNNKKKWKYVGVLHEMITSCEPANDTVTITGDYYTISGRTSYRNSDETKYLKDALILEKAYNECLKNNDELYNRYGFYCANSYFDYGKYEEAIKWYKITLENKNWVQEKYIACLRIYNCYKALNQADTGFFYLVKAFSYDKERVECLCELISHYCSNAMNDVAYGYYNIVKSFYNEKYLKYNLQEKLFLDVSKANFTLPYYMILIADKMQDFDTVIQMYKILFTKKHIETNKFFIGNFLYNLQFFIERVKNDTEFISLFKEYINFLNSINYPVYEHEFMVKYESYGILRPKVDIPTFSQEECLKSNKILFYTGYSPFEWNHTFSLTNALGGSETAVISLSKNFPKNYKIYIAGNVKEETVDNVEYVNLHNLKNLINTTAFHTIIVSRYLNFYEFYKNFSSYQTFIWGHDVILFPFDTNLSVENILTKWSSKINGCVCQTEWHQNLFLSLYPELKDKTHIINNGINVELFISKSKKINNRFLYTSCSERGLERLLELWPSISENIPDSELFISSYNLFPSNEQEIKLKAIIDSYPNVKHLGKLNKPELYDLMSTAEYWLYPTSFNETSCITSMEMLISEVICIYYPVAGLVNTLGDYGIPVERDSEIDTIMNLTNKRKNEIRKLGKEYALSCSWENRADKWCKLIQQKNNILNEISVQENNTSKKYPIHIINLKKRQDRKEKIEQQLQLSGIDSYEFFEAINGKDLSPSSELFALFERNDFNYKKGVIGCALSHIHLWNKLINDTENEFYVILEDDIVFCDNFKKHLGAATNLFIEQKIEHLALGEYNTSKVFPTDDFKIEVYSKDLYKEWNLTFAYIISKDAAKKAINYINSCSIKSAIDNPQAFGYILKYSSLNVKLVHCEIVNEFGSDIQTNNRDDFFEFNTSKDKLILTVSFCDWWEKEYSGGFFEFNNNFFTNLLREHGNNYEIKIVTPNENPNILFYSIFGSSHQNYIADRKVFFSGEPFGQRDDANFNITFDSNSLNNTRVPLWLCYFDKSLLEENNKRKNNTNVIPNREKFCSFIATGPGLANNRKEFVEKLSKYKQVDCGGSYLNNIGYDIPLGLNCSGKIEHNNNYKFAIAFESTLYQGYVTEKICDVFKSNCIPIYWGHPDVVKDFNPSTFINANDFSNFDELVDYIIKVDNDEELYKSFFKQQIMSQEWLDILNDPNKTFFKNLADKIIGNNEKLFNAFIENKEKWVIYGQDWVYSLLKDYINNLSTRYNINYVTNINEIQSINPTKIMCVNTIFDKTIFDKFQNAEISILNIDSLFIPCFLHHILHMIILYPDIKIYDYSKSNIDVLNKYNFFNTAFLEYVCDKDENTYLKELNKQPKIFDFGIIAYEYDRDLNTCLRRKYIVEKLRNNGFTVNIACGFGEERDMELSKCKIILNIHGKISYIETRTFEHLRCNRLLYAGFNVLSELSYIHKDFALENPNLKFIAYNDFEKITRQQIDNFSFENIEFDENLIEKFNIEQFNFENKICNEYNTKKLVNIFNIWHNKLFDNCYKDLDEYSLSKITMYDVNPHYEKIYNKDKNYKILKEYELENYNNLLQATNYCQTSCLYHVYLNGQTHKYHNLLYHEHYIGFIQYDMELESNFIHDIEEKINSTENNIFFFSLIVGSKVEVTRICNPYNNSILEKYNNYFNTNHTYESIINHKRAKYFICLHTFVIPTITYMKMMNWYCSISDWLHVNYINGIYIESMSEVTEELFGLFLLLQIIENDNIELEELKLKHNWPNLHNETSFNNYKDHSYYFPLSSIINNNLTDKNSYHSYIDVYENLFKNRQLSVKNVLEIGIEKGGSLKLWNDYFVNATIYGLDTNDSPQFLSKYKRIITQKRHAYSNDTLHYFLDKNIKFDVIVDDGPHTLDSMIFVLENYSKLLNKDGILIIEDVQVIEWCEILYNNVEPSLQKFSYKIDRRHIKGTLDDILFIVENKENVELTATTKDINKKDLWVFYAFEGHNYKVIEDYINSLKEMYNIVYTQDIEYVLNCNPKKISYIMNIVDDRILNKFKNTDVELSFLNTEPLSISYNFDLLKCQINKYPYLKIYDYSFSNLQIILHNNLYGELLEYEINEKENMLLKDLLINEPKIYDFGIITYGNTETNTVDNSLFHKKKDVVNELIKKGFKIHIISGWGLQRDKELAKCKVILNIHSILGINGQMYYSKTFENIRCNRLLDAGFKILSEVSLHYNQVINKYEENLKFINYESFKNIEYSEDFWDKISNKINKKYCVIHSCNMQNVGTYRLNYLVNSLKRCLNIFDKIYIINIGLPIENIYGDKFEIINYSDNIALYENPTINFIRNFSEINANSYVLYLHTKGVRYNPNDTKENDWIDYMLYFLVEQSQLCISVLNNDYETVGCNYNRDIDRTVDGWNMNDPHSYPSHYSGNFWWANSNYLKTLPLLSVENPERMAPEFWLFKNNPTFYNLHSSQVSHFAATYPRNKYCLN